MNPSMILGRVRVHPRGFGFINEEGEGGAPGRSAFLAPPDVNRLLDGDLVQARLVDGPQGRLSAVEPRLVERSRTELFGEVVLRAGKLHLRPDPEVANTDWPLERGDVGEVRPGDVVVARVAGETAVVQRRMTHPAEHGLERIIARHNLRSCFHADVLNAAQAAASRVHAPQGRRDLRDVPTVTVDGPQTRDIDDAISVLPAGPDGALRLLVSIADVAAFVEDGSPLDAEARLRATSVYLAGRVIPMLPESLSTDWLSLVPGKERWCLTVEMRIDPEGQVLSTDVHESIIRSWARLTYQEMAAFLDHGTILPTLEPVRSMLPWLKAADARLAVARGQRGGVVLERDEARVTFDARTGMASGLEAVQNTSAHGMIERFMVAANEAVARWAHDRGVPVPYRVHDCPEEERVADLGAFAAHFGLAAGFGRHLSPLALAAFERQVHGTPGELALRSVMRRLLGPARYTVRSSLHFGLAAPLYLHFTSPIRRYADLLVHRAVKHYLHGRRDQVVDDPTVEQASRLINQRSLASTHAEADRLRAVQAEYLSTRVGQVHPAHVTRVRPFGVVAHLDGLGAEGLIPVESLPGGPHQLDARETVLTGQGRSFILGMPLQVRVVHADAVAGRIELALAE